MLHLSPFLKIVMPTQRRLGLTSGGGMTASQQLLIDNIDNSGRAMLVVMDDLEDEEENPYAELEPIRQVCYLFLVFQISWQFGFLVGGFYLLYL